MAGGELVDIHAVCDRIRQDYACFPADQSYDLYAEAVFFKDPLNEFRGIDRYREMVGFIARWFKEPHLALHALDIQSDHSFQTRWTLSWITPLPWNPPMAISGWTEYRLNAEGKIISHIDYWDTPRLAVVGQVFGLSRPAHPKS